MTNCTWIGPAVIIQFLLQGILCTVGHVTRILFLSHEKVVITFTMSLRYSLVREVLPTQFLVASTATVWYNYNTVMLQ